MKKQVKIIDDGLDLYLMDANTKENIGRATFEGDYHIKYKGEDISFNELEEWSNFIEDNFIMVRDHKLRIEYRQIENDVQEDSKTREDIEGDILDELETALMNILDSHGIKYDMDSIRIYVSGADLE